MRLLGAGCHTQAGRFGVAPAGGCGSSEVNPITVIAVKRDGGVCNADEDTHALNPPKN